jgi:hypothetical protein
VALQSTLRSLSAALLSAFFLLRPKSQHLDAQPIILYWSLVILCPVGSGSHLQVACCAVNSCAMAKKTKSGSTTSAVVAPFQGLFKMVRDVMLGRKDELDNRRTEARFRVSIPLIAKLGDGESVCESVDLGNSGIRVLMAKELAPGDVIRLSVPSELGFAGRQRLLCEVAWCHSIAGRGFETGLLFADTKQNFEDSWAKEALRYFKVEEKANRKYRRIPAEVFTEVFSQDGTSIGRGICKNLSPGGALLRFDRELSQGEIVKLGLGPSDQEAAIFMLARIILRQADDQVGFHLHSLRFLKSDRRQQLRLRSFLQSLLEESASTGYQIEDELPVTFVSLLGTQETRSTDKIGGQEDEEDRSLAEANATGKIRVQRTAKSKVVPEPTAEFPQFNLPVSLGAPLESQSAPYPGIFKRPDVDVASAKPTESDKANIGLQTEFARPTPLPLVEQLQAKKDLVGNSRDLLKRLAEIAEPPPSKIISVVSKAVPGPDLSETPAADELPQNSPKLKDRQRQDVQPAIQPAPMAGKIAGWVPEPVEPKPSPKTGKPLNPKPEYLPLPEPSLESVSMPSVGTPISLSPSQLSLEVETPMVLDAASALDSAKTKVNPLPSAVESSRKPGLPTAATESAKQGPVPVDAQQPTATVLRSNSLWASRTLQLRSSPIQPKNSVPSVAAPDPPEVERDFQW